MIEPLRRSRVVPIKSPLPAAWLRIGPTEPDQQEQIGTLFRVGPAESLRAALSKTIDEAQEVVLLASFLLSDELLAAAMLRAAQRRVRVYVLTASEARLATVVREDDSFEARMVEEHKKLLDQLADHVVLRSAEHFHAKLLIADPATAPRGWISTANFNPALRDSIELGVELSSDATAELSAWFSWMFWMEAERELAGKGRLAKVLPPPAEPRRPRAGNVVVTGRDETSLRDAVLRLVRAARTHLIVCSYGLDSNHEAVRAIEERLRAGVAVTVLTRPRPAVNDAVHRLRAAGAQVLAHDKLHAKAIFSDDEAMVMTANLEGHGLDNGFEVGVLLDREGKDALAATLTAWSRCFPWRFEPEGNRADHIGEICLADAGLKTGRRTVVEEDVVSLDPVTAESALELEAAPEPNLELPREGKRLFQRVRFEWEVHPPRLPRKAKELLREVSRKEREKDGKEKMVQSREPYDPPVYMHAGRKLVVLTDPGRADEAKRLASELGAQVVVR